MFRILLIAVLMLNVAPVTASTLLVLGDSISAGYGLANIADGWVALLEGSLSRSGNQVINAGISGDTTAGGLNRLSVLLDKVRPEIVIIELGGNDGLRGISLAEMDRNLREMIQISRKEGATPVLLGMQMPPNYGKRFADAFEAIYPRIAKDMGVPFVEGFMKGVGGHAELMQPDAIHPNAKAQPILKDKVLNALNPLLKSVHRNPTQK